VRMAYTSSTRAASRSAACRSKLTAYTKEGSDMPYIAHDTNVIYAAADTAAAALAEAEKELRNRLPTEDIDKALKSLEVHEATTALVSRR
jgi:hypothetical protein